MLHKIRPQFATLRLLYPQEIALALSTKDIGLSATNEKNASSTKVTSASTAATSVRFDTCFSLGRHVPERLRRVVPDFRPDSSLFTSCSYFTQHQFEHQSSLSGRSCVHTSRVAVCMSLARSSSCELAPVRLIEFLSVIVSYLICSHTSSLMFNALSTDSHQPDDHMCCSRRML